MKIKKIERKIIKKKVSKWNWWAINTEKQIMKIETNKMNKVNKTKVHKKQ